MRSNHNPVEFQLINTALGKRFGVVSFNGKFTFELDKSIEPEVWQKIGIIPMKEGSRRTEMKDLFYYLNSRLPQNLRNESSEKKLKYIKDTGLRVASDSFILQPK